MFQALLKGLMVGCHAVFKAKPRSGGAWEGAKAVNGATCVCWVASSTQ